MTGLLIDSPLVWRSRLLYFVVFSAIAGNVVLFALGSAFPVSQRALPTPPTMAMLMMWLHGIGGVALLYWAYVQYRIPLDEQRAGTYATLGLLHAACIFMVLVNPIAFLVPAVRRVADVVPDAELAEEYAFHEAHDFWQCGETVESIDANRPRLLAALRAWGVANEISPYELGRTDCPAVVSDAAVLKERMDGARAAKSFRDSRTGPYAAYLRRIPAHAALSIVLGGLLLFAVVPVTVWRRRVLPESVPLPLRVALPRPAWLHALDRRLLANHPLLWSLRIHTFLFYLLIVQGLVLLFAALIQAAVGIDGVEVASGVTLVASLLLWFLAQSRIELHEPRLRGNRLAIAAFIGFTIVLCVPAASIYAPSRGGGEGVFIGFALLVLVASFVADVVYVKKYVRLLVLMPIVLSIAGLTYNALLISVAFVAFGGAWIPTALATWLIVTVVLARIRARRIHVSGTVAGLAAVQILIMPAVLADLMIGALKFELNIGLAVGCLALVVADVVIHVYLTTPAMRTLIRRRYWPARA